jgi:hypothetical protein
MADPKTIKELLAQIEKMKQEIKNLQSRVYALENP